MGKEVIELKHLSGRDASIRVDLKDLTATQTATAGNTQSQNVNVNSNLRKRNKVKSKCSAL